MKGKIRPEILSNLMVLYFFDCHCFDEKISIQIIIIWVLKPGISIRRGALYCFWSSRRVPLRFVSQIKVITYKHSSSISISRIQFWLLNNHLITTEQMRLIIILNIVFLIISSDRISKIVYEFMLEREWTISTVTIYNMYCLFGTSFL